MSQTNGIATAMIYNNKINIKDNKSNCDNDLEVLYGLQKLIPSMKENVILLSQQFTQFLTYTDEFDKLCTKFQLMKRRNEQLEKELEKFKQDQQDVSRQLDINSDNQVYLDVGGQRFKTTIKTLTQKMNSDFFQTLIYDKWNINTNTQDSPIFVDRDGRLFDYILKYLRTGELNIEDKTVRKELLTEAKYYKLQNLEDELKSLIRRDETFQMIHSVDLTSQSPPTSPTSLMNRFRSTLQSSGSITNNGTRLSTLSSSTSIKSKIHPSQTALSWRTQISNENRLHFFPESVVLTCEYEEKLLEFIGNDIQRQQWTLIYRASEHGFDAADFHRCCDTYTPTISIIQTDFGNIFGGFTSVPWSSASLRADQADPTAFLFSLKNTLNIPPAKFPVAKEFQQCAISHNPTCGPNFGSPKNEGSDLCLRNKFNEKTNCIFFPKSYVDTTNQGGLIFAKKHFSCKEVEVFTLSSNN